MLRFSVWKNSILRSVDTLKYPNAYQFFSKDFAILEVKPQKYYPGIKSHKAGRRGKECRGVGKGLQHKGAMCSVLNFGGSPLPSLKAQGCSFPAPHHSGHGSENTKKFRITVIQYSGAWLGRTSRKKIESWVRLQYVLI